MAPVATSGAGGKGRGRGGGVFDRNLDEPGVAAEDSRRRMPWGRGGGDSSSLPTRLKGSLGRAARGGRSSRVPRARRGGAGRAGGGGPVLIMATAPSSRTVSGLSPFISSLLRGSRRRYLGSGRGKKSSACWRRKTAGRARVRRPGCFPGGWNARHRLTVACRGEWNPAQFGGGGCSNRGIPAAMAQRGGGGGRPGHPRVRTRRRRGRLGGPRFVSRGGGAAKRAGSGFRRPRIALSGGRCRASIFVAPVGLEQGGPELARENIGVGRRDRRARGRSTPAISAVARFFPQEPAVVARFGAARDLQLGGALAGGGRVAGS